MILLLEILSNRLLGVVLLPESLGKPWGERLAQTMRIDEWDPALSDCIPSERLLYDSDEKLPVSQLYLLHDDQEVLCRVYVGLVHRKPEFSDALNRQMILFHEPDAGRRSSKV